MGSEVSSVTLRFVRLELVTSWKQTQELTSWATTLKIRKISLLFVWYVEFDLINFVFIFGGGSKLLSYTNLS
jgi:hypothetical protein